VKVCIRFIIAYIWVGDRDMCQTVF
jgi:hypothetical protein